MNEITFDIDFKERHKCHLTVFPVNAVHRFTEDGIDYVRVDIRDTLIDIEFVDIFANDPRVPPNLSDVLYVWVETWREGEMSQTECGFARWYDTIVGLTIFMGDNPTGSLPKFKFGRRLNSDPIDVSINTPTPNNTAHEK